MFLAAMTLQAVLIALIWLAIVPWLFFLDRLLIGGLLTALCALALPIGTALQVFADPSASRESLRASQAWTRLATDGTPQFTLRGILIATVLCSAFLAIAQAYGLSAAFIAAYTATFAGLAMRRLRSLALNTQMPGHPLFAVWYLFVATVQLLGGVLVCHHAR